MMMRVALTTIAAVGLGMSVSHAADQVFGEDTPYAPPAASFDWTGGYVGGFAGISHARSRVTDVDGVEFFGSTGGTYSRSGTSSMVGGTLGYNWQQGSFVLGPEIEAGYLFNDHFWAIDEGQANDPAILTEYGLYGVAAARLGFAVDHTLFYGKVGAAAARIRSAGGEFQGIGDADDAQWGFDAEDAAYGEKTRIGYAAGAGIEWAASSRWSLKSEYLFMDFGSQSYLSRDMQGGDGDRSRFSFRDQLHTFKIGVNYRF